MPSTARLQKRKSELDSETQEYQIHTAKKVWHLLFYSQIIKLERTYYGRFFFGTCKKTHMR